MCATTELGWMGAGGAELTTKVRSATGQKFLDGASGNFCTGRAGLDESAGSGMDQRFAGVCCRNRGEQDNARQHNGASGGR